MNVPHSDFSHLNRQFPSLPCASVARENLLYENDFDLDENQRVDWRTFSYE